MAEPYTGLCIGGPLDGQMFAYMHRTTVVRERADVRLPADPNPPKDDTWFEYIFHHAGPVAFWLPRGQSINDALIALCNTYQEASRGRKVA